MTGKSFTRFSRRMVRANARRQALSGPSGAPETAVLEIRIDSFLAAAGFHGRPVTDLKPEEIEIRVGGKLVAAGSSGRRAVAGAARDVVALLEEEPASPAGLETRLAPSCLRVGETYRDLSAGERRQLAIDLVAGGPGARNAQEAARLKLLTLAGRVTGRSDSDPWRLRFEPSLPASLAARPLDLYNVLLASPGPGNGGRVLVCGQQEGTLVRERLEVPLEGEGERIWGIVAVDPETGQGWLRRLAFRVPSIKTRTSEGRLP